MTENIWGRPVYSVRERLASYLGEWRLEIAGVSWASLRKAIIEAMVNPGYKLDDDCYYD